MWRGGHRGGDPEDPGRDRLAAGDPDPASSAGTGEMDVNPRPCVANGGDLLGQDQPAPAASGAVDDEHGVLLGCCLTLEASGSWLSGGAAGTHAARVSRSEQVPQLWPGDRSTSSVAAAYLGTPTCPSPRRSAVRPPSCAAGTPLPGVGPTSPGASSLGCCCIHDVRDGPRIPPVASELRPRQGATRE